MRSTVRGVTVLVGRAEVLGYLGDAGLALDPLTAQGMGHALRDAELLSEAIVTGDRKGYQKERDRQTRPMYDLTASLARLAPLPGVAKRVFARLAEDPAECDRFFGVLGGTVPVRELFSPVHLLRLAAPRRRVGQPTTAG